MSVICVDVTVIKELIDSFNTFAFDEEEMRELIDELINIEEDTWI